VHGQPVISVAVVTLVRQVLAALEYVLDADARVRLPLRLVERVARAQRLHLRLAPLRLHGPSPYLECLPHFLSHREFPAQNRRATCNKQRMVIIYV